MDTERLASKIIGSPVHDGAAADANNLGKINDLVLDKNGQVALSWRAWAASSASPKGRPRSTSRPCNGSLRPTTRPRRARLPASSAALRCGCAITHSGAPRRRVPAGLDAGMLDSCAGLIVPAIFNAFGIFLLRQYYLSLPRGLEII